MTNQTLVSTCATTACAYNNGGCTALAVTIGGTGARPTCATFVKLDARGGLPVANGRVGACQRLECVHNKDACTTRICCAPRRPSMSPATRPSAPRSPLADGSAARPSGRGTASRETWAPIRGPRRRFRRESALARRSSSIRPGPEARCRARSLTLRRRTARTVRGPVARRTPRAVRRGRTPWWRRRG